MVDDAGMDTIRVGTLGAARITPQALLKPARLLPDVEVVAVAARDRDRGRDFARKHGIARVHNSYADLVSDPEIDAVYNPLPNGLHGVWTTRALDEGKHVLCEKPFAANADEAAAVAARAASTDRIVMEAFHYRYHPLAERMRDIVTGGTLGPIRHIETWMCIPLPRRSDIRYQLSLAGGAMMDVGCYALHMQRLLGGEPEVVAAAARLAGPGVDRWMQADLRFEGGTTGRMTCALWSATLLRIAVRVTGERGQMKVFNPTGPHLYNRLTVRTPDGTTHERVRGEATYTYQLRAFADAVLRGGPVLTPPGDSVANMRVIDAIYRKAGMEPRPAGDPSLA
jgi:predicted dehydrogenase